MAMKSILWHKMVFARLVSKLWHLKFRLQAFLSINHTYDVIYGRLKEGGRKHTLEQVSQSTLKVSVFSAFKGVNK